MPNAVPTRHIVRVLQEKGFLFVSQKGSHAKFRKGSTMVIVPMHGKEIPYGTFRSILRQAKLSEDAFKG